MSKLAHSHQPTMDEIEFWRAYRAGLLNDMETAPRDGREIIVCCPDDMAPGPEKVRPLRVRYEATMRRFCATEGTFRGDTFAGTQFEGWIEP